MSKPGRWVLWSRGSNPNPWDRWEEETRVTTFETALTLFLGWRGEGQHVRLEWMPDNAYGPLKDNSE